MSTAKRPTKRRGRLCSRCGRDLDDPKYHDQHEGGRVLTRASRGRGRVPIRLSKKRSCNMTLIGTSPVSGAVVMVQSPQRTKHLHARFVHPERLQPGKDLHAPTVNL